MPSRTCIAHTISKRRFLSIALQRAMLFALLTAHIKISDDCLLLLSSSQCYYYDHHHNRKSQHIHPLGRFSKLASLGSSILCRRDLSKAALFDINTLKFLLACCQDFGLGKSAQGVVSFFGTCGISPDHSVLCGNWQFSRASFVDRYAPLNISRGGPCFWGAEIPAFGWLRGRTQVVGGGAVCLLISS